MAKNASTAQEHKTKSVCAHVHIWHKYSMLSLQQQQRLFIKVVLEVAAATRQYFCLKLKNTHFIFIFNYLYYSVTTLKHIFT